MRLDLLARTERDQRTRLFWSQEPRREQGAYGAVLSMHLAKFMIGCEIESPAAFRWAVKLVALTSALTAPVSSSITAVDPGRPPEADSADSEVGMDTILIAVPTPSSLEGMNMALWFCICSTSLCGSWAPLPEDRVEKADAMSLTKSSVGIAEVILSTSEAESTSNDMVVNDKISYGSRRP